jgi:hypothetical protein
MKLEASAEQQSKPTYDGRALRATIIAVVLFLVTTYCAHWLWSRGAFNRAAFERPIQLSSKSSIVVPFSPVQAGDHDVAIQYSPDVASARARDIDREFEAISGKAILRGNGVVMSSATLPVTHYRSSYRADAMILFTEAMQPRTDYALELQLNHVPPSLTGAFGTLRVTLHSNYYYFFPLVGLVAAAAFLGAIAAMLRHIRASRVPE